MHGLTYIRKLFDMSLEDLSKEVGVSNQLISMWELGKKPIPQKRIKQLAGIFGIQDRYFKIDISDIEKLEVQGAKYLHEVRGEIVVEDDGMEEGEGYGEILITPKNFDTDPRFAKTYQAAIQAEVLKSLNDIKDGFFNEVMKMDFKDEKSKSETMSFAADIIANFEKLFNSEQIIDLSGCLENLLNKKTDK
jgi:transcriptional regulator with XRE-family HTH domain